MALPFSYSFRNLSTRRITTFFTASGMALVVFVFAVVLMMAEGLQKTLVQTGSKDNVVILQKSSTSEVVSGIEVEKASIVGTIPQIDTDAREEPLLAKEVYILITMKKKRGGSSNIAIRGIGGNSHLLRPQVKMVQGRMPRPGLDEMAVGSSLARRFSGLSVGATLDCSMRTWRIVGIMDAGNTAFDSEIWADANQVMQAFGRPVYSSIVFRLSSADKFEAARKLIEDDPRLNLQVRREKEFYLQQSEMMARFLKLLGVGLTVIFSLGAVFGSMITMYAAVANRTAEIGTLRALGFRRVSILAGFLLEALCISLMGGCIGLFFASFMQLITISTANYQTLSELAFQFTLSPGIAGASICFSLIMGLAGGMLPALRASRMKIVDALRSG